MTSCGNARLTCSEVQCLEAMLIGEIFHSFRGTYLIHLTNICWALWHALCWLLGVQKCIRYLSRKEFMFCWVGLADVWIDPSSRNLNAMTEIPRASLGDEDELAVLLLKEIGSHLQGELLQLVYHPPFCGVSPIRNWGWSRLGGCVGGVTVGTFFDDMVYKSPGFELDKTYLRVYPNVLPVPLGTLPNLPNLGFLIF